MVAIIALLSLSNSFNTPLKSSTYTRLPCLRFCKHTPMNKALMNNSGAFLQNRPPASCRLCNRISQHLFQLENAVN
uniref:Uncharacterized protein n=1 Tax=Anguilla anguilla TaxID=7936 RepID=A0A0E9TL96_ANGAN